MNCLEARKIWLIPENQSLNKDFGRSAKHIFNCSDCKQYFKNRYKSLMIK